MSMMSFLIQDSQVNKDKLMKICMVHDLAESIVGDITPHDGVSKEEKRSLEEVILIILIFIFHFRLLFSFPFLVCHEKHSP